MANSDPLSFARCPAVVVFESEEDNMVSDWIDYIIVTRTKAGMFSVYARKWAEDYNNGRYAKVWRGFEKIKGITNSVAFIDAIQQCEEALSVDVDWPDVIEAVRTLDPEFSDTLNMEVYG